MPSYQFRSTSAYIHASGGATDNPLFRPGGPRRATLWDDMTDDDDPTGVVPDDDPAPVGDTPWLLMLLLAAGYVAYRAKNRRKA